MTQRRPSVEVDSRAETGEHEVVQPPEELRRRQMASTLGSLEQARDYLSMVREAIQVLLDRKQPLYEALGAAVMAGSVEECERLRGELRGITLEINALNAGAHEVAEEGSRSVREMLRPGEKVPK